MARIENNAIIYFVRLVLQIFEDYYWLVSSSNICSISFAILIWFNRSVAVDSNHLDRKVVVVYAIVITFVVVFNSPRKSITKRKTYFIYFFTSKIS